MVQSSSSNSNALERHWHPEHNTVQYAGKTGVGILVRTSLIKPVLSCYPTIVQAHACLLITNDCISCYRHLGREKSSSGHAIIRWIGCITRLSLACRVLGVRQHGCRTSRTYDPVRVIFFHKPSHLLLAIHCLESKFRCPITKDITEKSITPLTLPVMRM